MVFGYVLVSSKNSYEHEVVDKLSKLVEIVDIEPLLVEETAMADPFFEDYDIIEKIDSKNLKDLKKIIHDKIHTIYGVEKTKIVSRPNL